MKPIKYTVDDAKTIDLGTKVILKYPTPTKDYDIGHMKVRGRFPKDKDKFVRNKVCDFFMYVLVGEGTVFAGEEMYSVVKGDVVFIPANNKYAVDGLFEYITIDVPAFMSEQSFEVTE